MFGTRHKYIKMEGEAGGEGGAGGGPAGGEGGEGGEGGWYSGFKDPEVKGWMESLNGAYPDPESVAAKAYHMEKFLGADKAGRGVIVPKPDAKPEEWQEFYKKVGGAPEKADGYQMPKSINPEILTQINADPMAQSFKEFAHSKGIPPMFYEQVMEWYATTAAGAGEKAFADFQAQADRDIEELKGEWRGVEYDKNIELGKRAAAQFLPHSNPDELAEAVTRLEGAFGTKGALKLLATIGAGMGEHGFEGGQGSGGSGGMSPAAARVRIDSLKSDSGFVSRLSSGDAAAKKEWDDLHKLAYSK